MKNMSLQLINLKNSILYYVEKSNILSNDVIFDFDSDSYMLTCIFKRKKDDYILVKTIDINFHFTYSNIDIQKMAYQIVHVFDKFLKY